MGLRSLFVSVARVLESGADQATQKHRLVDIDRLHGRSRKQLNDMLLNKGFTLKPELGTGALKDEL